MYWTWPASTWSSPQHLRSEEEVAAEAGANRRLCIIELFDIVLTELPYHHRFHTSA